MLAFRKQYNYRDPLNAIFLCGSSYGYKDATDKRNILKGYIENTSSNLQPIILEENFWFRKTSKKYLSYDDIFLKSLAHIEQLASLFAWKIIVIHESISTAAEIGMFAINASTARKMCLLLPDDYAIEENKLSSFIKLAFFNRHTEEVNIRDKIVFYPDIEVVKKSPNKIDYYTYFHGNEIGDILGKRLESFLQGRNETRKFEIVKALFKQQRRNETAISYSIIEATSIIEIAVPVHLLKVQLLSLFAYDDFKSSVRTEKRIREHIAYIEKYYLNIMRTTVAELSGKCANNYSIECVLQDTPCALKQAIGYFIYMLQATKFISLEQVNDDPIFRKITIHKSLNSIVGVLSNMIYDVGETSFGRLMK